MAKRHGENISEAKGKIGQFYSVSPYNRTLVRLPYLYGTLRS